MNWINFLNISLFSSGLGLHLVCIFIKTFSTLIQQLNRSIMLLQKVNNILSYFNFKIFSKTFGQSVQLSSQTYLPCYSLYFVRMKKPRGSSYQCTWGHPCTLCVLYLHSTGSELWCFKWGGKVMVGLGRLGGGDCMHHVLGCPLITVINVMLELITEWDWQSSETLSFMVWLL